MSIKDIQQEGNALVNFVIIIAIGITFLGKMRLVSSITSDANTALGTAIGFVDDFFDWGGLIVLIIVIAYLYKKMNSAMAQ